MTELVTTWLLIVLALSLSCNLAYICRDMARENRRERRRREKAIQASNNAQIQAEALVKTLLALEEKNRADIVRGMDRRA